MGIWIAAALALVIGPGTARAMHPREPGAPVRRVSHYVVSPPKADPAFRRTFSHLAARPERTDRFDELILRHCQRNRLNPRLVKAIIAAESEFSTRGLSPKGARGLMQLMPATAEELGIPRRELYDPERNIRAGTDYLNLLYRSAWLKYGLKGRNFRDGPPWVLQRVVAAYHGGPRMLAPRDCPATTRDYVRKVLLYYQSPVSRLRGPPLLAGQPPPGAGSR